jgi:predicted nucleic acid-binding protein
MSKSNTVSSILTALELEARFQLSFWDALIVQAAERAEVGTLYSEDLSDGQVYGSVRVVDPLK